MRRLLFASFALFTTPLLHAQLVEIYGTAGYARTADVPTGHSNISCPVIVTPCIGPETSGTISSFAGGGGVTLNFLRLPGIQLGLDARGSAHTGNNGVSTGLGGLRLAVKPPFFHLKPWIEGAVGYVGTDSKASTAASGTTAHYAAAEVIGGIDTPLAPFFSWRIVEVGGGHAFTSSDGTKPTLFTIGTGLVFHF